MKITGRAEGAPLRVLHVVEGLASGVLSVLEVLAVEQSAAGAAVTVLYTRSADTPSSAELSAILPAPVARIEARGHRGVPAAVTLAAALRTARKNYDVVHAHSSWAGLVVRGMAAASRSERVWYTPHAFAFLRTDTSTLARRSFVAGERMLARIGSVAAVSASEARLARDVAGAPRVHVLTNRVRTDRLPARIPSVRDRPRVVCAGRVAAQKDPPRFRRMAEQLADVADVVWIGAAADGFFTGTAVRTAPWQSREETCALLADCDIFLSTAQWEGLPLALVEAQGIGLPAVCTEVPGNADVVRHGETGFLCETDHELTAAVRRLVADRSLYERMSATARSSIAERFAVGSLGTESLAMYAGGTVP